MIMKRIIFKSTQPNDYVFKYFFTERCSPIIMFRREISGIIDDTWGIGQWREWS